MLSGLGQYAGAQSVTLFDGTVIADPANTPATQEQCVPFWCGANPTNSDVRYWCGFWGRYGNIPCTSDQCAPYRSAAPNCNMVVPTPQAPNPPQPTPAQAPPTLTPQNIIQPLPNITIANAPVPVQTESPSCWCQVNDFINENPLMALFALAGVALLVLPKKGGR